MAGVNNYPGGFATGITIRGMPLAVLHPGKVFWVSNATTLSDRQINGSDNNKGTFDQPFATIAGALKQCVANRGDIIMVKPGHAETYSAAGGLVLNVAGVAIVGMGQGSSRPTLTLGTAATASISVKANNVSVVNILHLANFLDIVTVYDIANAQVATDFTIDNCEFSDSSGVLDFIGVVTVGTTANIADGFTFTNNKVFGFQTTPNAATTAITFASDSKRVNISNNVFMHNTAGTDTAAVIFAGGSVNHTQFLMSRNIAVRPNTSTAGHLMSSTSTACSGLLAENFDWHLDNSGGLIIPTGTKLGFVNNYSMITGAADKSALINPVAV